MPVIDTAVGDEYNLPDGIYLMPVYSSNSRSLGTIGKGRTRLDSDAVNP